VKGRDETAEDRDRAAELRDRGAEVRDARADEQDEDPASTQSDPRTVDEDQHDRAMAAEDRAEAAGDRAQAASDREESARHRTEATRAGTEAATAAERAIETLESMSDAFFTLDSEWRFTYLNPQAEVILGRKREDLIGQDMWHEVPQVLGSGVEDEYRRAITEQMPVRFEQAYEPLGSIFEVRVYPVLAGLAVYLSDVTEHRVRDVRLRQTERLETLGQLTAGIVHDFRNIVGAIGGFTKLGLSHGADPLTTQYFKSIASAGKRAEALTEQLLAFSRQQELTPNRFDLNETLQSLSSLLHQLVEGDIHLDLDLSPEPVNVFVDRSQLEQVVVNLVVNSRDAMGGTGSITITTTTQDPTGGTSDMKGDFGWLRVVDTGSGIPADVLPHIFDPFFSTKAPGKGTGLGLATIYGIVSQSGGSIFVDSTVGVGTTMTVALPARESG
jgi:two-component system cell cycle sensor histidine kinase/response regulator CckA